MAIEHVNIYTNSSIIQDEILAHRLGLIPIAVRPGLFDFVKNGKRNPLNTLVFKLHVKCVKNELISPNEPIEEQYENAHVLAHQIEWIPQIDQMEMLKENGQPPVQILYPEIMVAKMREGQEIEASLQAVKGVGREHAKWSPVGTASYRLMPQIDFTEPVC